MIKVVMRGDTPVYTRMARSDFLMVNGDSPPPSTLATASNKNPSHIHY